MLASQQIGRRAFLVGGSLFLLASSSSKRFFASEETRLTRFGLLTDLHHADKPETGTRFYRDTLPKLKEATAQFHKSSIEFVAELGDIVDAAPSPEVELEYLKTVEEAYRTISDDRHYVLGNHCVDTLTKQEFLATIGREQSYYSFDRKGIHFVVLDACFRVDGVPYGRKNFQWTDTSIPKEELRWLEDDLNKVKAPTIVFAHQRLDVANNHAIKNAPDVRRLLEGSGNVLAVFQGHSHENDLVDVNGIHYCTMRAMVEGQGLENSGYSIVDVGGDGTLRIEGFRLQKSQVLRRKPT
jgi:predicted phosphodiesterase